MTNPHPEQETRRTAGMLLVQRRREKGISQEDLANRLHVTRQTVSGWERDRTQPDLDALRLLAEILDLDLNELICGTIRADRKERGGGVVLSFYLASVLSIAGYFIYRAAAGGFSFELDILPGLAIFMATIVFLPLQYSARSGDFTILAGYDRREEANYRPEMLCRMVRVLQLFLCLSTFSFCILFFLFRFANAPGGWFVYLIILFVIDYIGGMILISFKYQSLVLVKPRRKSFGVFAVILIFIAAVAVWIGFIAWLSSYRQFPDNSPQEMWTALLTFGMLAATLPWLVREITRAVKAQKEERAYRPGRFTIAAGVLYLSLLAAAFFLVR